MTRGHTEEAKFEPFYERFARTPLVKLLVSFGLGISFFIIHRLSLGQQIYFHFGWMLAPLITFALLFLYYATAVFRDGLSQMEGKLSRDKMASLVRLSNSIMSDRAFVMTGLAFGILNYLMGVLFQLPVAYQGFWAAGTSYLGFVIVGFACGLPVCGIYGVSRVIQEFARDETLKIDCTASDECGGMEFIGDALVKFASVTVTMGVLIAWYILHMRWSGLHSELVNAGLLFWVAWPFIVSAFVLIFPGVVVHQALKNAKEIEDQKLQEKIQTIEAQIDDSQPEPLEGLLKKHEFYTARRGALNKMRTWPYDLQSKINYSGVVLGNLLVAAKNVQENPEIVESVRTFIVSG